MIRPAAKSGFPKALLITRNLPPLRGGMERLLAHVATALAATFALTVIGPTGCGSTLPPGVRVREVKHGSLAGFLFGSFVAVLEGARHRFDLVFAGSGLTAPMAWLAARLCGARMVVYLHGLDIVADNVLYRHGWLPFIRRADLVLVNSSNTRRLAIDHGIPEERVEILHPGTDLPGQDNEAGRTFREAHQLADRPMLLSVGRFTPRKGLVEFILHAMPAIIERMPDAVLLVIGADANDAVRPLASSMRSRILCAIEVAGIGHAVRMLPPCDDASLSDAYDAADVHIFPVIDCPGDVEGFGMVAIEAAAHGVPTVAFRVGGVPDAVIDGVSGSTLEPGDYDGFASQVVRWLRDGAKPQVKASCLAASVGFGWERFEGRLRTLVSSTSAVPPARRGHAVMDLGSRAAKAAKIARLLGAEPGGTPRRMLEIGTGAGGIAHYFGHCGRMGWTVESIDVQDVRLAMDGYRFTRVEGVELPFEDGSFDIVVSNHVIEHVGDAAQQSLHVREMKRVLAPGGVGYLAVPCRWMITEPHYRLPLLSWLPLSMADAYVRITGKGTHYDCRPLTTVEIERIFALHDLSFEQQHGNALRLTYEFERPASWLFRWILRPLPEGVYAALRHVFPTLIYVFRHAAPDASPVRYR